MLRKHLKLLLRFVVVSFRNSAEFRADFFTSIVHNIVYQVIFIIFWKSILGFTANSLGEWTFQELAILSAFSLLSTAIMQWMIGFLHLSDKVVHGEMDKYLCKPISPLFGMLAEEIKVIPSIQQLVSSVLIIGAVVGYFHVDVTLYSVVSSLAVLAVGCFVVLLIQGFIALSTFWFGDVSRVNQIFMISGEFERYPINLFPLWLQGVLTWIIPIGLISTYPVLVFLGKVDGAGTYFLIGLMLASLWMIIFRVTWRRALLRYESFGG